MASTDSSTVPTSASARRSSSQHRLSTAHPASGIPIRGSHASASSSSRAHSHSLSTGSSNRVTRRKSMSSNAGNLSAVANALNNSDPNALATSVPSHISHHPPHRRSLTSKRSSGLMKGIESLVARGGALPSPPESSARPEISFGIDEAKDVAVVDGPPLPAASSSAASNKARMRRASEGAHLLKTEGGRRVASGELKCDTCGKGYKHSSCLTKHLWEHTPEWAYTSKLLISKHQQVQLLEAASVLVQMNVDDPTPPDSAKDFAISSDNSSASPDVSGMSDLREHDEHDGDFDAGHSRGSATMSSTETTPPPQIEGQGVPVKARRASSSKAKRYSAASSSAYSRSYQSAPSSSFSMLSESSGFSNPHFQNRRSGDWASPTSSDSATTSSGPEVAAAAAAAAAAAGMVDDAGLAAAVGLLSCSFGTPRSGPTNLPPDVPPVPPLPARFLSPTNGGHKPEASPILDQRFINGVHVGGETPRPFEDTGMKIDGVDETMTDRTAHRDDVSEGGWGRGEEDEVGVFGRMEE